MSSSLSSSILRAIRQPSHAFAFLLAVVKGFYYRGLFKVLGRRFTVGRRFRVFGSLSIKGPGSVEFGDDVSVWQHVTPWTHDTHAKIYVGHGTRLSGVRMGCQDRIQIGNGCIIAECRIMDTDFHSLSAHRFDRRAPVRTAPVTIADNVWIAAEAGVLPGTIIGQNSVVGFGAVCSGNYPEGVIVVGNPGRVGGKIPEWRPELD